MVRGLYESHGSQVILGLDSICEGHSQGRFDRWPSGALAELGTILYKEFPPTPNEHTSGFVSRTDEARWARNAVTDVLLGRGDAAKDALRSLADAVPTVQAWVEYQQAQRAASSILDTTQERQAFPLSEVLRVLTESDYRLIRTDADLFNVLVETLTERIAKNTGEHVEMLYDRQHRHLREDALQAYVACRLKDLLPGKVLHRETKITRRQRTDILVEAPTAGGAIASAVIEAKWSDNRSLKDSVVRQLGRRYLLDEGKTHGIFLVGWSGSIRWSGLRDRRPDGLLKALDAQASRFQRRHSGVRIRAVHLDLRWSNRHSRPSCRTAAEAENRALFGPGSRK
jgi:hypothetical protein